MSQVVPLKLVESVQNITRAFKETDLIVNNLPQTNYKAYYRQVYKDLKENSFSVSILESLKKNSVSKISKKYSFPEKTYLWKSERKFIKSLMNVTDFTIATLQNMDKIVDHNGDKPVDVYRSKITSCRKIIDNLSAEHIKNPRFDLEKMKNNLNAYLDLSMNIFMEKNLESMPHDFYEALQHQAQKFNDGSKLIVKNNKRIQKASQIFEGFEDLSTSTMQLFAAQRNFFGSFNQDTLPVSLKDEFGSIKNCTINLLECGSRSSAVDAESMQKLYTKFLEQVNSQQREPQSERSDRPKISTDFEMQASELSKIVELVKSVNSKAQTMLKISKENQQRGNKNNNYLVQDELLISIYMNYTSAYFALYEMLQNEGNIHLTRIVLEAVGDDRMHISRSVFDEIIKISPKFAALLLDYYEKYGLYYGVQKDAVKINRRPHDGEFKGLTPQLLILETEIFRSSLEAIKKN